MTDDAPGGTAPGPGGDERRRCIVHIQLDEKSFHRRRPEVEHEREIALFDLLEENVFELKGEGVPSPPYRVHLRLADDRLVFDVRDSAEARVREIVLAVRP